MSSNKEEQYPFPVDFDNIVDHYNEIIQQTNQLRKSKNEEYKSASPKSKYKIDEKFKPQIESNMSEMKKTHSVFVVMIEKYLQEYKENQNLQINLIFPPKLIGEFRKSIHDLADKFGLFHESIGSGASRKVIVSKEIFESQPKKKIKIEPNSKQKIPTPKKEINLKTLEFPPDEVTNIQVVRITEEAVAIIITPPESYGSMIKDYIVYSSDTIEPDSEKVVLKFEAVNKSEVLLKFNETEIRNNLTSEITNEIEKNSSLLLKFKLSAINEYGESFLSQPFQIQINKPLRGHAYICGSCQKNKIPCKTLNLAMGTISQQKFIEIPLTSNHTNSIKSSNTTLILLDSGILIQCGLSLMEDSSKTSNKQDDNIIEVYSEPYLPCPTLVVYKISIGKDFCALVSCLGEVFTWGFNGFGQLGHDDKTIRTEPTMIKSLKDSFIVEISCGNQHSLALDEKGRAYSWGRNQAVIGQKTLLDPYGKINNYENIGVNQFRPRLIKEVLGYYKLKKVCAGGFHNAAITEKNELYVWGDNESGQLGLNDLEVINITIPKQIPLFQDLKYEILDVSCGGLHTLALIKDNEGKINLWSWGDETQGQCGSGEKKSTKLPSLINFFEGKRIEKISAGSFHSLVLIKDEGIYGFGYNGNGEIGTKSEKKKVRSPFLVKDLPEGKIERMEAGFEISCLNCIK